MKHSLTILFLILFVSTVGCIDFLHVKSFVVDFNQPQPKSFALVENNNFDEVFNIIEQIALKNGLTCQPYDEKEKRFVCSHKDFKLATYVIDDNKIRIELFAFGPVFEPKEFKVIQEELSSVFKIEFNDKI